MSPNFTEPILGHLQVPPMHEGPMSEVFRVMIGVLKNRLWSNVPAMSEIFQICIREAVALEAASLNGMCMEKRPCPPQSLALTHVAR